MTITKRIILLLLAIFLCGFLNGSAVPDSLQNRLLETEGYDKMVTLFDLSKYYRGKDIDQCKDYNQQALELAYETEDPKNIKFALTNAVKIYYQLAEYDQSIEFARHYLDLCIEIHDSTEISKAYNNLGVLNKSRGKYEEALTYFNSSIEFKMLLGDTLGLAKSYNNVGLIYSDLEMPDTAITYYNHSLEMKETVGDSVGMVKTMINIGIIYNQLNLDSLAFHYTAEALELSQQMEFVHGLASANNFLGVLCEKQNKIDEAISYLKESMKLNKHLGFKKDLAHNYNNIGRLNLVKGDHAQAAYYLEKAVDQMRIIGSSAAFSAFLSDFAQYYIQTGRFAEAEQLILESLQICQGEKLHDKCVKALQTYSEFHIHRGDYKKGHEYYLKSEELRDSLLVDDSRKRVTNLQIAHNVDKEVSRLRSESVRNEKALEKAKQLNYSLFINLLAFLLILIILAILYFNGRKNKRMLNLRQEELNKQNEFLNVLVATIPSPMYYKDMEGKYLGCNDAFVELIGLAKGEIVGNTLMDLLPEQEISIHQEYDIDILKNRKHVHYESPIISMGGRKYDMLIYKSAFSDNRGEVAGIIGVLVDVTESKKALDEIKENGSRLQTLNTLNKNLGVPLSEFLQIAMSGLSEHTQSERSFFLSIDNENEVCHILAAYDRKKDSMLNLGEFSVALSDCLIVEKALSDSKIQIISKNELRQIKNFELRSKFIGKDLLIAPVLESDKLVAVFCTQLPVVEYYRESPILSFFVSEIWNIVERKIQTLKVQESEQALREANMSKDKFFSIIAHDLKNPFHGILGFANLLKEYYTDLSDKERLQYVENLYESTNVTYKLLENLLQWANAQTGRLEFLPEYIDLNILGGECLMITKPLAGKKEIVLEMAIDPDTIVYADPDMIRTIFRNLATNAIKFTARKGKVKIMAAPREDFIMVCIEDNGIGMFPEELAKLFNIGEKMKRKGTEEEGGTGIGLNLCKEFIDRHGGEIWADSTPGNGSTFCFTLPINKLLANL
jgi:PAS domain S-box-containing protein